MAHYAFLNNDATTGTLKEELNVLWDEMGNLHCSVEEHYRRRYSCYRCKAS